MSDEVRVNHAVIIPEYELEITTSRAGGPGGQHVNKTNSRVTVRWNVIKTNVFNPEQKQRIIEKLSSELTTEGDLIISSGASRSQLDNKKRALAQLAHKVASALHVPKKRMKSKMPTGAKESRLKHKKRHSAIKKMRSHSWDD